MADSSRNIFVINDGQNRHKITQQWSLHAQVTLSSKPDRSFEYQRGNIVFSAKPPAPGDSGYVSSSKEDRYSHSPPYRKSGFTKNEHNTNNQFVNNQAFSNNHTYNNSNSQDYDKKCFNSCKVTVDCNHQGSSLYPGAHHTFTLTTEGGHSPPKDSGLCEICSGVGSHSPTTARRREQFTSHFCTRVPDKKPPRGLSKDASIQTSIACVPDVLVQEDLMTKANKTSKKTTNCKVISSNTTETPETPPKSDKKSTPKIASSTSNSSTTRVAHNKPREKKCKEQPCPLTKLKRQTLSSGSLRKCPNLLMHSSTSAVQKYSNFLSPKPLRKATTTSEALNNCDIVTPKPDVIEEQVAKSWRTSKSKIDSGAGSSLTTSHSISKTDSLDSLKNGCDVNNDLMHSDTTSSLQSSCSTISCSDCSYNSDSMSDTSDSSTLEDGSVSRSDSFEYADSFEYDDSFDKLRIEEKERTWRKKNGNGEASASKDQIRHQKFAEYLMKRSTTSPFPSWKSSNVSISTVYSDDDDDTSCSSSSSSSISADGSMSELGWSFASKCNNPTRLNSLNSVTSSVFDKEKSSRKLGPQKMDSLDSGSYSDSSQQTFCSQISVGKRETSVPKQIPSTYSSFSKAEKFGPVVGTLRKPGHHIGPSKNPDCSCATCVAHFESVGSGKAKTCRTESCDSFQDSDCSSGLDSDPTCEVR